MMTSLRKSLFFKKIALLLASAFIYSRHYFKLSLHWLKAKGWRSRAGEIVPVRLTFTDVEGQPIQYASGVTTPYLSLLAGGRSKVNADAVVRGVKRALYDPVQDEVVPSDDYLFKMINNSAACYNLIKDPEYAGMVLDLSGLDTYHTNPDRYFDIRKVHLMNNSLASITIKNGHVVTPESKEWNKAKLHLISNLNLLFPALSHNWVHFHFSDIATVISHNLFPIGEVLHQWLSPFMISNLSTNENGKGGAVMDRDMGEKKFFFSDYLIINHTDNEYFVDSVAGRTLSFYSGMNNKGAKGPVVFGFPPKFPAEYADVPYVMALEAGYKASKKFVDNSLKSMNDEEINLLQEWKYHVVKRTTQQFPANETCLASVLSTFIWQVCWVHTLDHQMYFKWTDGLNSASGTLTAFHEEGRLFSRKNQIQFKNMADVAIRYNPNGDSLADITYNDKRLQTALDEYRSDLLSVINRHVKTDAGGDDFKSLSLDEIAPSVLM
ncbi:MAG: hypothetical protein HRU20_16010 [Pseudomonadales bacterium]|nr:hypothetical protein [Pseudomonadales bacterium]